MTEVKSVETIRVSIGEKILLLVKTKGPVNEAMRDNVVAIGRKLNDWFLNSNEPFYSVVYPGQIELRVERVEAAQPGDGDDNSSV